MTQDEIIRMAREAGFTDYYPERLTRFAALVAAHEREQEMKAAEKAIYVAIGLEREACAKVCEELQTVNPAWVDMNYAEQCAAAIRSRNNAN